MPRHVLHAARVHRPAPAIATLLAAIALLLAACAAPSVTDSAAARSVVDGEPFTLDVGDAVAVPGGGRIDYLRLVSDSRCPPDAQCVWAGVAEIALRWTPADAAAEEFRLTTEAEGARHRVGSYVLHLRALERGGAPRARLLLAAAGGE